MHINMNVTLGHLINAVEEKFSYFEVKLWNLLKDRLDLSAQIEEFEKKNSGLNKLDKNIQQVGDMDSTERSFNHCNGKLIISSNIKRENPSLAILSANMRNKFIQLQNRLHKCEMHLWSLLDERMELQSIIWEMRRENDRHEMETKADIPTSIVECILQPITTICEKPKRLAKKRMKRAFICDICDRRFNRKDHLKQHLYLRHVTREFVIMFMFISHIKLELSS